LKILIMTPQPQSEWVAEETLATDLNMDRDLIHAARLQLEASDVDTDGPWIVWKKTAAKKFAEELGLPWPPIPPAVPPVIEEVTVVSAPGTNGKHFPNPRIIRAKRANGELVYVTVMESGKFVPRLRTGAPMVLKAQKSAGSGGWVLVGRGPRWKGAW
jgi:hypothetical protein